MKVKVTVENLETGEKASRIGDGAIAYVEDKDMTCVLSLGEYHNLSVVSHISDFIVNNMSERHPRGAEGAYDDIIDELRKDAEITRIGAGLTPRQIEGILMAGLKDTSQKEV